MVLKQDVAALVVAEVLPVLVLAVCHECVPHLVVAFVLQQFHSVEPVLHVLASYYHHGCVEAVDVERLLFRRRYEVVERAELAVAFHSELGVRVAQVVKNLELAAYGRALAFVGFRVHEVFYAAVGALCYLEVYGKYEAVIRVGGDDVTSV